MKAGLLILLALPVTANAETMSAVARPSQQSSSPFVFSGVGPGEGNSAINLGVRCYLLIDDRGADTLPIFDLQWVHGLSPNLDYELRLSTLGLINFVDTGVRMRVWGDADFSLSTRLNGTAIAIIYDDYEIAPGIAAGVQMSTGSERVQFSLGVDAIASVLFIHQFGASLDTEFKPMVRPWLGIEAPLSSGINVTAQAQLLYPMARIMPSLSLGLGW